MNKLVTMSRLLVVSLAINLLIAGAVLGQWVKSQQHRPPATMGWAIESLDDVSRKQVHGVLEQIRPATQEVRHKLRQVHQALFRIARADVLDAAALEAELGALRDVSSDYQLLMHNAVVSTFPELAPEQRLAVLHRLIQRSDAAPDRGRPPRGMPPKHRHSPTAPLPPEAPTPPDPAELH